MQLLIVLVGILFTFFSALILSYISIATMVGPWIAPTLVLFAHPIIAILGSLGYQKYAKDVKAKDQAIAAMQAIGAGGGIIATGVGFALPMLYFLEPATFNAWIQTKWYFFGSLALLCIAAGGLGLLIGHWLSGSFIDKQTLPFPVSALTHQAITSPHHPKQSKYLFGGIGGTFLLCWLRDGLGHFHGLLAKNIYLLPSLFGNSLAFAIWPSLWAIGINVGFAMTIPLLIGLLSKYVVIYPLVNHANYLPISLFPKLSTETCTMGFCSGIILFEVAFSIWRQGFSFIHLLPKAAGTITALPTSIMQKIRHMLTLQSAATSQTQKILVLLELIVVGIGIMLLLGHYHFSLLAQGCLIGFTILATYVICLTGAEIGLVPLGRFSFFILIPLMLLFKLSAVQATIACVFFHVCAATSSDLLFDYKTGTLCSIDRKTMYRYQWIGLIVTALSIGIILWLLFTNLQLGSEALVAQRGQTKALLLQTLHFDLHVVLAGVLFGLLLKKLKLNATMVFGGLIMPNSVTIGLALGSVSTLFVKKSALLQSVCAGILTAESLWILVVFLSKML